MTVRFGRISRIATGILLMTGMLILTSCKTGAGNGDGSTVSIKKDGSVLSYIEESFAQSYYDAGELQQTILREAASYNKGAGSAKINVEKVEVDEGVAIVRMTYQEPEDYAAFNGVLFFAGEAGNVPDGYELNVVLSGVKDEGQTVGKSDILAMDGYKILITDITEPVLLNGKAEYASDNMAVSDDRKSAWMTGEGTGYVLYK